MTPSAEVADPPAGLLLAAGGGTRLGRPKALVSFRGEPLVCRGVRLLRHGGCDPVVVVVGAAGDEVTTLLTDAAVDVVDNPQWRAGMGSSLRAGLAALGAAPAAVVALVDQPLVAPEAVRRLIAAWRAGARIAAASYGGQARNPVLFDARVFAAAAAGAHGDQGARGLLREQPDWVERVACDAVASPRDIDTLDDLRALSVGPDPNPVDLDDRPASKEPPWS
ncbi:MAG TPA: NTP transferase domain-containing protein [Euzebyales bacterium]|nr:NTP transferase domain-containing protein [Euzebyales bacterium]